MSDITRREFLRGAAAAGAALLAVSNPPARAEAPAAWQLSGAQAPRAQGDFPAVVVAKGTNADSPAAILQAALAPLGGIGRFVKPGQTVAIKPNATWAYPPGTASSTDPGMLAALIQMVRDAGAGRVLVVDRSTLWPTTEVLQQTGIGKVLDDLQVEWIIPDGPVAPAKLCKTIELPEGKAFKKLNVLAAGVDADVRINLAVAKSHKVTKYTLCLKHMMGWIQTPGQIHAKLEQGIADLSTPSPMAAHLHILEAIRVRLVGQAGGKQNEITNPKLVQRPNEIVAGTDPVLIDAYGLQTYFGRKPKELLHVYLAGQAGTGEADVQGARAAGRLHFVSLNGAPEPTPAAQEPAAQGPAATETPQATSSPSPAPTRTAEPTQTPTNAPSSTSAPSATGSASGAAGSPTPLAPTATHTAVPTSTPLPTATPPPTATSLPSPIPTNTPLPTPLPLAAEAGASGGTSTAVEGNVLNPGPFLNQALAPVAAVIVGAGIVYRGRMSHRAEPPAPEAAPVEYRVEPEEEGHEGDASKS